MPCSGKSIGSTGRDDGSLMEAVLWSDGMVSNGPSTGGAPVQREEGQNKPLLGRVSA